MRKPLNRRRIVPMIATALCGAFAATGCTTATAGTPGPASGLSPGTDVFAGMNACRVLDQLLAGQGFDPGENKSARNECTANKSRYGGYSLALDPVQGLADFRENNPGAAQIRINDRPGLYIYDTGFQLCALAIEITEQSRVLVIASMINSPQDQTCHNAKSLAERLEPSLPTPP